MRIDVKRCILTAALALGTLWDVLCLWGMFRGLFPNDEKSKYIAELDAKERAGAGLMICLAFAWAATLAACFVYPL